MFEKGDNVVFDSQHFKFDGTQVPGISGQVISVRAEGYYDYYLVKTHQTQTAWVAAERGRY